MVSNWGMFNYHENNNTLLLKFIDDEISNRVNHGNVNVCFNKDDKLVGYEIPDFIRFAKIKYSGIIFMPNHILVDVINNILINEKLEPLAYKNESGYVIKKMNNGKLGVYVKEGTFTRDKSISTGKFCSFYDLFIENENEKDLILIDDNSLEGCDFFVNKD